MDIGNFISSSSAFSKTSLKIWKFSVHILLNPDLENFEHYFASMWTSLVAQTVLHLPAMQETWVRSLGWEVPLEKEMATHSSTLAGKSHGQRSLVGYSPWGRKELDTNERLH